MKLRDFNKLPKKSRRIALAKDVLRLIKSQRITPVLGEFMAFNNEDLGESDSLKKLVNDKNFDCEVCAKGALFAAWVSRFNSYKYGAIENRFDLSKSINYENLPKELLSIFGRYELDKIESYYESDFFPWSTFSRESIDDPEHYLMHFVLAGPYYRNMEAIMNNIIINNGTFKPE